jgi:predicted ribosomally synthesized peptide with SipW-like signal peptide
MEGKEMSKKIIMSVLVILLAAAAVGGATMAWFTDEAVIEPNVFTAGTLEIKAGEVWEGGEGIENWNPGDCEDKEVTVEITGSKTTYLRMQFNDGWYEYVDEAWVSWEPSVDPIVIKNGTEEFPTSDWVKIGDWYYYINDDDPDDLGRSFPEDVITVITEVCLDGSTADNQFQGKQYRIGFNFEAIQTTNNAVDEVWGVYFNGTTWEEVGTE